MVPTKRGLSEESPSNSRRRKTASYQSVVEVDECIGLPEAVSQFVAGYDLAGSFQEHREDLKWRIVSPMPL